MGDVFRAVDQTTGETVALKRMMVGRDVSTDRFMREGSVLALLSHPNVVRYIAHGVDTDGHAYIAMEWLRGEDLQQRLRRGPLSIDDALDLATRVADALGAAHALGIVHRDIKPSNIFLVDGNTTDVRLLDFGIAKPLLGSQKMTATGSMLGTLGYLSPEQAINDEVDARSDVFSLGCVLFECLTGRPAFTAAHPAAILAKVVMDCAPAPSTVDPSLSPIDDVVLRLLARDRHDRPQDGAAAAAAIRAGRAAAPSPARSPTPSPRLTARERESLTVLLARAASSETDDREKVSALVEEARGRHAIYADDTLLCVWDADIARDQVIRAGRLALTLWRDHGRSSVIATGYGERTGDRALGEVLERAASLLDAAGAIDVLVDPASAEILQRRFEIIAADGGARLGRELDISEEQKERAPLVGRDRELRLLCDTYRECSEDGVSRAMLVTAEAGMGKSRLLREVLRACRAPRTWKARGDPMRPGAAYALLSQLVRRALALGPDADAAEARAALAKISIGDEDGGAFVADFLLDVLGLGGDAPSEAVRVARAEPSLMAARVRDAVAALSLAIVRNGPLVIALEDLHWGDAPTLRVVEHVVARCAEMPLFVIGVARPDFRAKFPGAWTSEHCQEIRLAGLSRKAAEKLARSLDTSATPEEIANAVDRAGGSPLWLEELFRDQRAAADSGARRGEAPATLLAIIQAHLAREPQLERRVLRAAAIFGERFLTRGIPLLVGLSTNEVDEYLRALSAKEWILRVSESRIEGQVEMAFRHGLLRDAVYATLTPEDLRAGHGLAARWLMSVGETDAVTIASHLERSERPADAIPHYVRAAGQALVANDLDGTLAAARRGIDLGATGPTLVRLRMYECEAAMWLGDTARAASLVEGLLDVVELSDPAVIAVLGWTAMIATMRGDVDKPLRAMALFEKLDRSAFPADEYEKTASYIHSTLLFQAERARADELVALVERGPEPTHLRALGWRSHTALMHARFSSGDTWAERRHGLEGIQRFAASFDTAGQVHLLGQTAITELTLGAYDRAIVLALEGEKLAQRYNHQLLSAYPLGVIACVSAARRERDRMEHYCEAALRLANQLQNEIYGGYVRVLVAYALRLAREPARAIEIARASVQSARLLSVRAAALMQLAGALVETGAYEEALASCLEVASLTQPKHMRGALDLDFMASFLRALAGTGAVEARDAMRARTTKIVTRRAESIDDEAMRKELLQWATSLGLIG